MTVIVGAVGRDEGPQRLVGRVGPGAGEEALQGQAMAALGEGRLVVGVAAAPAGDLAQGEGQRVVDVLVAVDQRTVQIKDDEVHRRRPP